MENKVFCIGPPRTGTTSMCKAGEILGYKTWHYGSPKDCNLITDNTIEYRVFLKNNFFADLPIPLYYKELDIIFPNSKFIFTFRNLEDWISSIKYIVKFNCDRIMKGKPLWDDRNFKLWKKFFGTSGFDRKIMEEKFTEFSSEVCNYFKGRNDFLFFNIEINGWEEICEFLNKDIPDVPFPHKNKR